MQKLTQDIAKHLSSRLMDWHDLSINFELSEDIIIMYQDKVDWDSISCVQKLSEEFIMKFQDRIIFRYLIENECLIFYSEKMQKLILEKSVHQISKHKKYYFHYMTDYMKKQYKRIEAFI